MRKKIRFLAGAIVYMKFVHSLHAFMGFLWVLSVFPCPKDVHIKWCLHLTYGGCMVAVGVCVSPAMECCPVQGWFPPCFLSCQDRPIGHLSH